MEIVVHSTHSLFIQKFQKKFYHSAAIPNLGLWRKKDSIRLPVSEWDKKSDSDS